MMSNLYNLIMKCIPASLKAGLIHSGFLFCLLGGILVAQEDFPEPTAQPTGQPENGLKTDLEKGRALAAEGKLQESLPFLRKAADEGSLEAAEFCARVLVTLSC